MNASMAGSPLAPSMASDGARDGSHVGREAQAPQQPVEVVDAVAHARRVRVAQKVVAAVDVELAAHGLGEVGQLVATVDERRPRARAATDRSRRAPGARRSTGSSTMRSVHVSWAGVPGIASSNRCDSGPCPRSCRNAAASASRARSSVTRCADGQLAVDRAQPHEQELHHERRADRRGRSASARPPGTRARSRPSWRIRRRRCTSGVSMSCSTIELLGRLERHEAVHRVTQDHAIRARRTTSCPRRHRRTRRARTSGARCAATTAVRAAGASLRRRASARSARRRRKGRRSRAVSTAHASGSRGAAQRHPQRSRRSRDDVDATGGSPPVGRAATHRTLDRERRSGAQQPRARRRERQRRRVAEHEAPPERVRALARRPAAREEVDHQASRRRRAGDDAIEQRARLLRRETRCARRAAAWRSGGTSVHSASTRRSRHQHARRVLHEEVLDVDLAARRPVHAPFGVEARDRCVGVVAARRGW